MRSAAGTSDTARGRCLRTASAHRSSSKRSSSANGLCLADALQHAEHAADVHQRGVDDRDTAAAVPSGSATGPASGPITLRASMS